MEVSKKNKTIGTIIFILGIIFAVISLVLLIGFSIYAIVEKKMTFYPIIFFSTTIISGIMLMIGIYLKNKYNE